MDEFEEEPPVPPRVAARLARQVRRIMIVIGGFTLILFGFLLGFVPGIPGWPLGILGLSILAGAGEIIWARRLMKRVKGGARRLREVFMPRRYPPARVEDRPKD